MKMTNEEYKKYAERHSPRTPSRNLMHAFLAGGAICLVGQVLLEGYGRLCASAETASAAVSITMIFIGAVLTGLGVYDDLAKYAGAGTLVPITGFANSVVAPALEFKTEGIITGTCAKMFVIAGPVIVCGVSASVVYGLILCVLM